MCVCEWESESDVIIFRHDIYYIIWYCLIDLLSVFFLAVNTYEERKRRQSRGKENGESSLSSLDYNRVSFFYTDAFMSAISFFSSLLIFLPDRKNPRRHPVLPPSLSVIPHLFLQYPSVYRCLSSWQCVPIGHATQHQWSSQTTCVAQTPLPPERVTAPYRHYSKWWSS